MCIFLRIRFFKVNFLTENKLVLRKLNTYPYSNKERWPRPCSSKWNTPFTLYSDVLYSKLNLVCYLYFSTMLLSCIILLKLIFLFINLDLEKMSPSLCIISAELSAICRQRRSVLEMKKYLMVCRVAASQKLLRYSFQKEFSVFFLFWYILFVIVTYLQHSYFNQIVIDSNWSLFQNVIWASTFCWEWIYVQLPGSARREDWCAGYLAR